MKCLSCQVDTENPKYCSRSCSATDTNKKFKKKVKLKIWLCKKCGESCAERNNYCDNCRPVEYKDWSKTTIKEMKEIRSYQKSSRIRELARSVYKKSDKPKYCTICKYSHHYEICHIKAINSFSEDSVVAEVNHINNLIALCPNCHWELDNGLITIPVPTVGVAPTTVRLEGECSIF